MIKINGSGIITKSFEEKFDAMTEVNQGAEGEWMSIKNVLLGTLNNNVGKIDKELRGIYG